MMRRTEKSFSPIRPPDLRTYACMYRRGVSCFSRQFQSRTLAYCNGANMKIFARSSRSSALICSFDRSRELATHQLAARLCRRRRYPVLRHSLIPFSGYMIILMSRGEREGKWKSDRSRWMMGLQGPQTHLRSHHQPVPASQQQQEEDHRSSHYILETRANASTWFILLQSVVHMHTNEDRLEQL